jgi:2-polyprenyl-6-methoxyphenol hydroxylase-like FAD-dependent oxidoreductase
MSERIVIAGAGIAGLAAAMALARSDREILILDRDGALPSGDADEVFLNWTRRGATQVRHSHVFLGRLVRLLRQRHPTLWSALMSAGAREFCFGDALPLALRDRYRRAEGDEDFSILFSRRTTLESVMRGYVAGLAGVRFVPDAFIRGLSITQNAGRRTAEMLAVDVDGAPQTIGFDSLVDATGRGGPFCGFLSAAGIDVPEDASPAGIIYFTRHYRFHPEADEPTRDLAPRAGDLGYIKYGVFPADNRCFSITLACPEIEYDLRVALPRGDAFDRICALLPGCAPWTDPARAAPVSKVYAMGNLKNAWRRFVKDGEPVVANYYPVGDVAVRTNPLYGRGCSTAFIQAFALADAFATSRDPAVRMRALDVAVARELRPFFDAMVRQDVAAVRRARHEQNPAYRPRLKARIMRSFVTDGIEPATRGDLVVLRALMRPFHMHEHPAAWTKRLSIMARVVWMWMLPRTMKRAFYPPSLGPSRASLLAAVVSQADAAGAADAPRAA